MPKFNQFYESRPCLGEAHKDPTATTCPVCAPFFLYIPTCPTCESKLILILPDVLKCPTCQKTFSRSNAIQVGIDL